MLRIVETWNVTAMIVLTEGSMIFAIIKVLHIFII